MVTGCPLFTFTTPTESVTGPSSPREPQGRNRHRLPAVARPSMSSESASASFASLPPLAYQFGLNAHGEQLQNCETAVLALTPFSLIRGATPADPHTHRHSDLPGRDKRFAAPLPPPP